MAAKHSSEAPDPQIDAQAREQTGQRQVRIRVDERKLNSSYANAFRTNGTAEEIMIDFGLNVLAQAPTPTPQEEGKPADAEMIFQVNERIVLNYFTAKRLAITLGQLIKRFEDQFGELKLNVAERGSGAGGKRGG